MYNQNPFYSPSHSNFIKFLPHALKSGCNRAVLLIEGLFCTKSIIGKRVPVIQKQISNMRTEDHNLPWQIPNTYKKTTEGKKCSYCTQRTRFCPKLHKLMWQQILESSSLDCKARASTTSSCYTTLEPLSIGNTTPKGPQMLREVAIWVSGNPLVLDQLLD